MAASVYKFPLIHNPYRRNRGRGKKATVLHIGKRDEYHRNMHNVRHFMSRFTIDGRGLSVYQGRIIMHALDECIKYGRASVDTSYMRTLLERFNNNTWNVGILQQFGEEDVKRRYIYISMRILHYASGVKNKKALFAFATALSYLLSTPEDFNRYKDCVK